MIPSRVIEAKRDGGCLPAEDLRAFLFGFLDGSVPDYQVAALLMAVHFRGMTAQETSVLVDAMLGSGARLEAAGSGRPRIDKHSTGGVGDKVSLVLAPLAAEMGMDVPMMSGRGLGHTTGTLDKLEAIPGFRIDLPPDRFTTLLARVGCAMTGQTAAIAPLARTRYALRDVTGTVPAIPLIAASIMSKKLAETLDGLVLDVKVGNGAFLPGEEDAETLARTMVRIGRDRGLATVALLTAMDRPLGTAVGNALETAEAIRCLRNEGPEDLRALVLELVGEMASLAAPGEERAEAMRRAAAALDSGRALERFRLLVEAQGGDPSVVDRPDALETAPERLDIVAERDGSVVEVRPRVLGEGVIALGGGRVRVEDGIDAGVGFEILVRPGDPVATGDRIARVHARDASGLEVGRRAVVASIVLGEASSEPPAMLPLVLRRITEG